MSLHRAESTLVRLRGLRTFTAQRLHGDLFVTQSANAGRMMQLVVALQEQGVKPRLRGDRLLFKLDELVTARPQRWRLWLAIGAVVLLVAIGALPYAHVLQASGAQKAFNHQTCVISPTQAKNFALSGVGSFENRASVTIGGVTVLSVASTCSRHRYKITLDASAKRVISVRSD